MDDPNTLQPNAFYQLISASNFTPVFQTDAKGIPINLETSSPGPTHTNYLLIPDPKEYARLLIENSDRNLRLGRFMQDRLAKMAQTTQSSTKPRTPTESVRGEGYQP